MSNIVETKTIGWASYGGYEGPFYLGKSKFSMPDNPGLPDKILATITASEGGSWNAINMYDRCVVSVGLIQWCEGGQFSVSDMLGVAAAQSKSLLAPLTGVMGLAGVEFKQNSRGRWRFFFQDTRGEVDRLAEQQQLFLRGPGSKGSWTDTNREYAKAWAAALAEVYQEPNAIATQRDYTVPRLYDFALKTAKDLFNSPEAKTSPIGQAFICAYLSFAANNPARADASLKDALKTWNTQKGPVWSPRWFNHVLERLTFASGVTIYPHRYDAIRPVLERLFGIDIPDLSDQLADLLSPLEIQGILVHQLHYDLGKSGPNGDGVDGQWGKKSTAALADFERRNGLDGEGLPDANTNAALLKVRDAR
jgi:putative peptidoglycan binding protein